MPGRSTSKCSSRPSRAAIRPGRRKDSPQVRDRHRPAARTAAAPARSAPTATAPAAKSAPTAGNLPWGNARSVTQQITRQDIEDFLNQPELFRALLEPVIELEGALRAQAELEEINNRLYATIEEDIPDEYRDLVQEYYRVLSETAGLGRFGALSMQVTQPTLFTALQQGNLSFAYGVSLWLFGLLALPDRAAVWASYYRTTRPLSPGWKAWFIGLRSAVLILILFCLLRPVVNTRQVSPQDTYLAVLLDHSQSMSIADVDGRSRADAAADALLAGPVMEELAESFQLRTFAFDQNTRRVGDDGAMGEPGTGSAIGQASKPLPTSSTDCRSAASCSSATAPTTAMPTRAARGPGIRQSPDSRVHCRRRAGRDSARYRHQ